jgi:3-hydroxyisobutyrate dehydrogenase-like beta-hydroxyacid dehydrogenase
MARRISESGHSLTLWARSESTLEPFADVAFSRASTPAEVGTTSEVVGVCVRGDADVEDVVLGSNGVLKGMVAGSVLVIHSTVHPDTCRRLGSLAVEHGVDVLDAPVSGGGQAARDRRLLVLVGGDTEVLERVTPVLSAFGDPIRHVGPLGAGQTAKLVNNALFAANLSLANDALALGVALGLDESELLECLKHGSANSGALGLAAGMRPRLSDPSSGPANVASLLTKDLNLVGELAAREGAEVAPLREVADRWLSLVTPLSET